EIALCARDEQELHEAAQKLKSMRIEVESFACDLSRPEEIGPLVQKVLARFGRIDILVNNAGLIKVAPLDNLEKSDFEEAMDLMFWAPLNLTMAVLPHMRRQGDAHIVNITSIGGRVSIPHLIPYSCAKFALVGFSTGLA